MFRDYVVAIGVCTCLIAVTWRAEAGQTSGHAGKSPASIREVDFRNFRYPTSCSEDPRFPPVIPVKDGGWEKGKLGEDQISYSVRPPVFGHLLGTTDEQAVIDADCSLGNGDTEEIFIYGMANGQVKLIQRLTDTDWAPNRDAFDETGVTIRNNHLEVTYTSGGSHAQPKWTVSRTMTWNGHKFVPGPVTRKPYKP
jgi:hypothetical protein